MHVGMERESRRGHHHLGKNAVADHRKFPRFIRPSGIIPGPGWIASTMAALTCMV